MPPVVTMPAPCPNVNFAALTIAPAGWKMESTGTDSAARAVRNRSRRGKGGAMSRQAIFEASVGYFLEPIEPFWTTSRSARSWSTATTTSTSSAAAS